MDQDIWFKRGIWFLFFLFYYIYINNFTIISSMDFFELYYLKGEYNNWSRWFNKHYTIVPRF
jgi:hypothetical protein